MTKNPFINALSGLLYIALLVSTVYFLPNGFGGIQESVFYPIAFLSVFVFSAASMSYVFLYQPLMLFLEGHKKESVSLFLKTLGLFAASAAVLVLVGLTLQFYF